MTDVTDLSDRGADRSPISEGRWGRGATAGRRRSDAQHNLGVMYEDGEGVPQDYVESAKW